MCHHSVIVLICVFPTLSDTRRPKESYVYSIVLPLESTTLFILSSLSYVHESVLPPV